MGQTFYIHLNLKANALAVGNIISTFEIVGEGNIFSFTLLGSVAGAHELNLD